MKGDQKEGGKTPKKMVRELGSHSQVGQVDKDADRVTSARELSLEGSNPPLTEGRFRINRGSAVRPSPLDT